MVYFILAVVILFIGKFIYDSFLTNNTEKNWDVYKKSNPNQARVLETNSAFNLNTKATIRTDGYYLANFKGKNKEGQYSIPFLLIFTSNGLVVFFEDDNADDFVNAGVQKIKEQLIESDSVKDCEPNLQASKYEIKDGAVSMFFYDSSEFSNRMDDEIRTYNKWEGTILNNGLLLNFIQAGYSGSLNEYTSEIVLKDLKFDFVQIKFKKI